MLYIGKLSQFHKKRNIFINTSGKLNKFALSVQRLHFKMDFTSFNFYKLENTV